MKRTNADLLRNYYGIGSGSQKSQNGKTEKGESDPNDAAFDVNIALKSILQNRSSLASLLKEESTLLTDIRELDGERQSLVYNHHHELVQASETMRKMKQRADALMPSLNTLQSSLQAVSSNSNALTPVIEKDFKGDYVAAEAMSVITLPQRLRDLIILAPTPTQGLTKARELWGSMEAVLASWDEAGVQGAKEIMHECRLVLRQI